MTKWFGREMAQSHGNVLPNSTNFRGFGVRGISNNRAKPSVHMDCQISINTPPRGPLSTVRGAHLDSPIEIYAGLLYLRDPRDKSKGGDLQVLQCASDRGCPRLGERAMQAYAAKGQAGTQFEPEKLRLAAKVPYAANTLVMFINTPQALHAVTPRSFSSLPRRFVNIVAQENFVYVEPNKKLPMKLSSEKEEYRPSSIYESLRAEGSEDI
mmetsp:Transcript_18987/g.36233  ORF Transcript_18987/g.36233 Transcript_18987/m.36233 type:complete len:211 (-) Transcript_18987:1643-2275(-)